MLNLLLLPLHTEEGAGATPYVIGIGALVLLVFGAGREHS